MISTNDFSIDKSGETDVTEKLQKIIDYASSKKDMLVIEKGIYLVSALYLKSNLKVYFAKGSIIKGTTNEDLYPLIKTRVAGIDMPWYPAILNIIDSTNVHIYGKGIINGSGEYWYHKYWGNDMHGGMRKIYDENNLRWACDYECKRVRNILVSNSNNIIINGLTSKDSGFWNLHILYSNNVIINNVTIASKSLIGPSTDGIDIDSSSNVLVENCITYCNDDSICIKSGRDSDGIKRGIPSKNIIIRNCKINQGFGVTIGSEVSGGIENIHIHDIEFNSSECGFRIKTTKDRKGYIKNIYVNDIKMLDVKYPIHIYSKWNPSYSRCEIPSNSKIRISPSLMSLLDKYNDSFSNTIIDALYFNNIVSTISKEYDGFSRCFTIVGFDDVKIRKIKIDNLNFKGHEFGIIENVSNLSLNDLKLSILKCNDKNHDDFDNR